MARLTVRELNAAKRAKRAAISTGIANHREIASSMKEMDIYQMTAKINEMEANLSGKCSQALRIQIGDCIDVYEAEIEKRLAKINSGAFEQDRLQLTYRNGRAIIV